MIPADAIVQLVERLEAMRVELAAMQTALGHLLQALEDDEAAT